MLRIITCSPVLLFSCFQTRKNIADSLQIHVGFYTYLNKLIGGIKIRLKISIFYGEKVVHLVDF